MGALFYKVLNLYYSVKHCYYSIWRQSFVKCFRAAQLTAIEWIHEITVWMVVIANPKYLNNLGSTFFVNNQIFLLAVLFSPVVPNEWGVWSLAENNNMLHLCLILCLNANRSLFLCFDAFVEDAFLDRGTSPVSRIWSRLWGKKVWDLPI